MARLPRLIAPGLPHWVMHVGHNRQAVFVDSDDRRLWLELLTEAAPTAGAQIHAYLLLDDRVQLLLTPQRADAVARMLQDMGRRYVHAFNRRHGRRGTLWEGRFRSVVLQPERHLIAAMVQMDTEPVRRGLVTHPREYAWSSFGFFAGLRAERVLTPHALIWALGNTPFAREAAYQARVEAGNMAEASAALERALQTGWPLGDAAFVADAERIAGRRAAPRRPGRPSKVADNLSPNK